MKSIAFRMMCRFLIATLMAMPFQFAHAGMIGTDKAVAAASAQADRTAVLSVLSRSDVQAQMQARGLDPRIAAERVATMTDDEVRTLAGQLDSLPAGAKSNGWVWAAVIIIAVVIWYNWK